MKKITALLLAVLMSVSLLSSIALAAESETVQPRGWGGPAPQITKIELNGVEPMKDGSGRFSIVLKVTGGGHGEAYFDGKYVEGERTGYFINYGNTADGFYWTYVVGPVSPGTYTFKATFTSTNHPYSQVHFEKDITFIAQ